MSVVRCDCTLDWCKKRRDEQARLDNPEKRHFSVPSLASVNGQGPRVIERKQILRTLRPGGKEVSDNSTLVFLWWHLRPSAFEWRSTFAKKTKNKTARWFVRNGVPLAFSNLPEEPPPDGQNAVFQGDGWVTDESAVENHEPEQQEQLGKEEFKEVKEFKSREITRAWKIIDEAASLHEPKVRNAVNLIKAYVDHIKVARKDSATTPSYPSKRRRKDGVEEEGEGVEFHEDLQRTSSGVPPPPPNILPAMQDSQAGFKRARLGEFY